MALEPRFPMYRYRSEPVLIPSLDMVACDIKTGISPSDRGVVKRFSDWPHAGVDSPSLVHAVARKLCGSTPRAVITVEVPAAYSFWRSTSVDETTCSILARSLPIAARGA